MTAAPRGWKCAALIAALLGALPWPARSVLAQDQGPALPSPARLNDDLRRGADGRIEAFDPTQENGAGPRRCHERTLCVGPDQAFSSLGSAAAAARDGDVIEVVGGLYRETVRIDRRDVTVRGIDGRPHFDCDGLRLAADKSCLLLVANNITLENIEISGAVVPESLGANGACIRNGHDSSFTIRNVICHGSQDGILSDGGTIVIENSEFYDNGWTGLTHNVYFSGACKSVTVWDSIFRDARVGHEFKSRCAETRISGSTFRSTKGSRDLDIPDGGATTVEHSTLVKTPGVENDEIIGFSPESCKFPADMVLKDVRIVNFLPHARIHNFDKCTGHPIVLEGVTFEGSPIDEVGDIVTR